MYTRGMHTRGQMQIARHPNLRPGLVFVMVITAVVLSKVIIERWDRLYIDNTPGPQVGGAVCCSKRLHPHSFENV
jgi:hypothetical protein